jgi:hypothetical protein
MHFVVRALDKNDDFLNFLAMTATVVGPDLKKPIAVEIEQSGPGRYVGSFAAREAGSYFVTIDTGRGAAPIRTGVDVPYSDEFRDRDPNDFLLRQLAETVPKGGLPGKLIEESSAADPLNALTAVDTFRHDLPVVCSMREIWHWMLLLAGWVFLGDVFIRRVHVHLRWLPPLVARCGDWLLRRQPRPAQPPYLERLRRRKAEVAGQLDQLRGGMRFESSDATVRAGPVADLATEATAISTPPAQGSLAPDQHSHEESYTERLLRAKKQALEDRPAAP